MPVGRFKALLSSDSILRVATTDRDGYPHITPLWFVWDGTAIYATSKSEAPHLRRLAVNPRTGLLVDREEPERPDGERPNRQFRGVADAELTPDTGQWTKEITQKYIHGESRSSRAALRASHERVLITLVPRKVVAVASV